MRGLASSQLKLFSEGSSLVPRIGENDDYQALTAYLDSSGRARTRLRVELTNDNHDVSLDNINENNISFEIQVVQSNTNVYVEGVRVLEIEKNHKEGDASQETGKSVRFTIDIVMRVATDVVDQILVKNKHNGIISAKFELSAVFLERRSDVCGTSDDGSARNNDLSPPLGTLRKDANLDALLSLKKRAKVGLLDVEIRSKAVTLHMELVEAFTVSCRSLPGARAAWGATLISVTISHSNKHAKDVIISGISLHPGHARPVVRRSNKDASFAVMETSEQIIEYTMSLSNAASSSIEKSNRCMQGGNGVISMSRHVRWCYAAGAALDLPLKLERNEAYSTVLQVDASDDHNPRHFMSPVSVTGHVGECTPSTQTLPLVVSAYASWTTSRVTVAPADAFRVDMAIHEDKFRVGEPLTLIVKVLNLSTRSRNLMLLINSKKAEEGADDSVPVMAEVGGYSFGVWGLTDNGGDVTDGKDDNILAIDAARLLGDVLPQQVSEADLRFVPLREGTLDIPNFKLYDMTEGEFYDCMHSLKIMAEARA